MRRSIKRSNVDCVRRRTHVQLNPSQSPLVAAGVGPRNITDGPQHTHINENSASVARPNGTARGFAHEERSISYDVSQSKTFEL